LTAGSRDGRTRLMRPAIMGSADGVTIVLGLLVSLAGQPHVVFRAAAGAALAELVGMGAGQWLSDEQAGLRAALANGGAAFTACLLPAVPYLLLTGRPALAASLALVVLAATGISLLRPERGILAFATTYGILSAAAALCWAASLI
jgi:VIT1/CCC1 family predicted Fe2+/Mn2+ transporter